MCWGVSSIVWISSATAMAQRKKRTNISYILITDSLDARLGTRKLNLSPSNTKTLVCKLPYQLVWFVYDLFDGFDFPLYIMLVSSNL